MPKLFHGDLAARLVSERIAEKRASSADIKAIPRVRRIDGMLAVRASDYSIWVYEEASTAAAGSTVLVPDAGPGRWHNISAAAETSAVATSDWYVDSVSGNDDNSGTSSGAPLKTFAELEQRLTSKQKGKYAFLPGRASSLISAIQIITINLLSMSMPITDPLNLRLDLPPNSLVSVIGSTTTVASGTLSAASNQAPATNNAATITDGSQDWTANLNKRVRNTTAGPNLDQHAYVAKNAGGGVAWISTANNPNLPAPANAPDGAKPPDRLFQTAVTPGVFSAGDTYVIEDLTTIYLGHIDIGSSFQGTATLPVIGFAHIAFQKDGTNAGAAVRVPSGAVIPNFKGCTFAAAVGTSPINQASNYENCGFFGTGGGGGAINVVRSTIFVRGGIARGQISTRPGSFVSIANDLMVIGVSGNSVNVIGGTMFVDAMAVFDGTSNAVAQGTSTGNAGGYADLQIGVRLWGSGNTSYGLDQGAGCKCRYNSGALANITVTGTSGDFRQAGATTHRNWNEGTGSWSSPIANTWAGIANNNAQNVARGCLIALLA